MTMGIGFILLILEFLGLTFCVFRIKKLKAKAGKTLIPTISAVILSVATLITIMYLVLSMLLLSGV